MKPVCSFVLFRCVITCTAHCVRPV